MRLAARLCTATMVTFEVQRFGHPGWRCASFYAPLTSHPLCYVSFPIRLGVPGVKNASLRRRR